LWGYIDSRDAAQAIRKALEAPLKGFSAFIIANAETVMSRPNAADRVMLSGCTDPERAGAERDTLID
jgi:hypothetical protein